MSKFIIQKKKKKTFFYSTNRKAEFKFPDLKKKVVYVY